MQKKGAASIEQIRHAVLTVERAQYVFFVLVCSLATILTNLLFAFVRGPTRTKPLARGTATSYVKGKLSASTGSRIGSQGGPCDLLAGVIIMLRLPWRAAKAGAGDRQQGSWYAARRSDA